MRRSVNPRTCVACRRERKPREMLRIVRTPDGQVVLDERGKQSGRGAYVCPEPQCVALCLKKNLLEKALKCKIPNELNEALRKTVQLDESDIAMSENSLLEEIKSLLGLSRRAGELLVGQDRTLEGLSSGKNLFVLLANDHSAVLKRAIDVKTTDYSVLKEINRVEFGHLLGLRQAQIAALPAGSGFAEKIKKLIQEGGNVLE